MIRTTVGSAQESQPSITRRFRESEPRVGMLSSRIRKLFSPVLTMFFSRQRMLSPGRPGGAVTQAVTQLPGPSLNPFWWQTRLYPDSGIGGEYARTAPSPSQCQNYNRLVYIIPLIRLRLGFFKASFKAIKNNRQHRFLCVESNTM